MLNKILNTALIAVFRTVAFPFVLGLLLFGAVRNILYGLYSFALNGAELTIFSKFINRHTIIDLHKSNKELLERIDEIEKQKEIGVLEALNTIDRKIQVYKDSIENAENIGLNERDIDFFRRQITELERYKG